MSCFFSCVIYFNISLNGMDLLSNLLEDKDALIKFYQDSYNLLIKEYNDLQDKMKELGDEIIHKEKMIKLLRGAVIPTPENSEILELPDYKWRTEVMGYLANIASSGTSAEIATYIIRRDNIRDIEAVRELRNKVSITCAGLYRDKKLARKSENAEIIYSLIVSEDIFSGEGSK